MSIIKKRIHCPNYIQKTAGEEDALYQRDALGDLKHGLDLIFELKDKIESFHPVAAETLMQLLSN